MPLIDIPIFFLNNTKATTNATPALIPIALLDPNEEKTVATITAVIAKNTGGINTLNPYLSAFARVSSAVGTF